SYDLLLLAVKAYSLRAAARELTAAVGPRSLILPLLNGMRHLEILAGRFGDRAVLGGLCQLTTVTEPDGTICQLNERHELVYGPRQATPPALLAEAAAALASSRFVARQSGDILAEMWAKWVHVAAVGALTCLMRATVGEVIAVARGAAFAERVLAECAAVAAAAGHPIEPAALAATRATITEPGSPAATSLYRDLIEHREVESEQVIGDLVDRAAVLGVPVPLLELVRIHLEVYQAGLPTTAGAAAQRQGTTSARVPEFRSATGPTPARPS
ncbi:MAG: ketopantoate reductase C-terminal domain-containing protein, partial [Jatrophihabitantaceae bacterium]